MTKSQSLANGFFCLLLLPALLMPAVAVGGSEVPGSIVLEQRGYGWVLRDVEGMSLYITDRDQTPQKSTCVDDCAEAWPPLIAVADASAGGDWGTIQREDGSRQWTFRDKPLHRYKGDQAPGHTFGDGKESAWHLAVKLIETPPSIGIRDTQFGHLFVDEDTELTLYVHAEESMDSLACDAKCAMTRLPAKAPLLATGWDDWGVVTRADGVRQWAHQGSPLYRFSGDRYPGEATGHQDSGPWRAAILEPPPPLPSWVTVQGSDAGAVLADQDGLSLYGRTTTRVRVASEVHAFRLENLGDCGVECPGSPWRPVIATTDAQPISNWTLVDREDGNRQWAFEGEPLYTNTYDERPGQLHGVFSGDRSWHALLLSGERMQGTGN